MEPVGTSTKLKPLVITIPGWVTKSQGFDLGLIRITKLQLNAPRNGFSFMDVKLSVVSFKLTDEPTNFTVEVAASAKLYDTDGVVYGSLEILYTLQLFLHKEEQADEIAAYRTYNLVISQFRADCRMFFALTNQTITIPIVQTRYDADDSQRPELFSYNTSFTGSYAFQVLEP